MCFSTKTISDKPAGTWQVTRAGEGRAGSYVLSQALTLVWYREVSAGESMRDNLSADARSEN